jgi:hypothetical protein
MELMVPESRVSWNRDTFVINEADVASEKTWPREFIDVTDQYRPDHVDRLAAPRIDPVDPRRA